MGSLIFWCWLVWWLIVLVVWWSCCCCVVCWFLFGFWCKRLFVRWLDRLRLWLLVVGCVCEMLFIIVDCRILCCYWCGYRWCLVLCWSECCFCVFGLLFCLVCWIIWRIILYMYLWIVCLLGIVLVFLLLMWWCLGWWWCLVWGWFVVVFWWLGW